MRSCSPVGNKDLTLVCEPNVLSGFHAPEVRQPERRKSTYTLVSLVVPDFGLLSLCHPYTRSRLPPDILTVNPSRMSLLRHNIRVGKQRARSGTRHHIWF
jgi:hypothetical protein